MTGVVRLAVRAVLSKGLSAIGVSSISAVNALILSGVAVLEDTATGPVLTSGTGSVSGTPGTGISVDLALGVVKTSHGSLLVTGNKVGNLLLVLRVQLEGKTALRGTFVDDGTTLTLVVLVAEGLNTGVAIVVANGAVTGGDGVNTIEARSRLGTVRALSDDTLA